jgi:hypothetical protein
MIVLGLYIMGPPTSGPWPARRSVSAVRDTKASSPDVEYKLYGAVDSETLMGCAPELEFRKNMGWDPVISSPGYGKVLKPWRSVCCGVYKTEFTGLFDLPVMSDLADGILNVI